MEKNVAYIELTGWLNEVKEFHWGLGIKVAVDVRKQNHQDEWETVDKTIYDVAIKDKSRHFEGFKQVKIKGQIYGTATFPKRDGSTGSAIKVRAEVITPVGEKVQEAAIMEQWPTAKIGDAMPTDANAAF